MIMKRTKGRPILVLLKGVLSTTSSDEPFNIVEHISHELKTSVSLACFLMEYNLVSLHVE